jgi:AhpD family alkylhydroperoxidase
MDEKMKELIAIGASVSGHCQPCLAHHVDQARRLGIGADEIKEAVAVGRMVEKGAMSAMNKFVQSVLDTPSELPAQSPEKEGNGAKALKVYDPAMCCPTGVCGPNVDSALVEFAGAVKTAAELGVAVERFNLARQPQAFAQDPQVKKHLAELGHRKLPFIYIDDKLKWSGRYPSAKELFTSLGMEEKAAAAGNKGPSPSFAVLGTGGGSEGAGECRPGEGCCS